MDKIHRQDTVFCNRALNMNNVHAVGFDMDHTLVVYKVDALESLSYSTLCEHLIQYMNYPKHIAHTPFDPQAIIKGLFIDIERGNFLKLDRHKYVKMAYHGSRSMDTPARQSVYQSQLNYFERDFAYIETSFAFSSAFLFSVCVDLKEDGKISKSFPQIYADIKQASHDIHNYPTQVLMKKVAEEPEFYIKKDPFLKEHIKHMKACGKKNFLVTNNSWTMTNTFMPYIWDGEDWLKDFEVVITEAEKPNFFHSQNPCIPHQNVTTKHKSKVFTKGSVTFLNQLLGLTHQESNVLYIGDHVYGDVLCSKKELGWRTMMIIEELTQDLKCQSHAMQHKHQCDTKLKNKFWKAYHSKSNPKWGSFLKSGSQNSYFAYQIQKYACLYAASVSHLRHYPMTYIFRGARDLLPHDLLT